MCAKQRLLTQRVKEHNKEIEQLTEEQKFTREASKHSTLDISKQQVTDHARQLNHVIDWDSARIVAKEADWKMRGIKEAINIRREKENMDRDERGYTLSHLYDDLLDTGKRLGIPT